MRILIGDDHCIAQTTLATVLTCENTAIDIATPLLQIEKQVGDTLRPFPTI